MRGHAVGRPPRGWHVLHTVGLALGVPEAALRRVMELHGHDLEAALDAEALQLVLFHAIRLGDSTRPSNGVTSSGSARPSMPERTATPRSCAVC